MQKPPVVAKTNERIAGPYLYRRRPPRSTRFPLTSNWSQLLPSRFLLLLGLVCGLVGLAQAQTSNLTSPSTTTVRLQSGESTLLNLAAPSTFPLYISLSLCSIPASLAGNDSFLLPAEIAKPLYVSNSSSDPRPGPSSDPDSTGVPRGAKGDSSALLFGYSNVTLLAAGEGNVTIQVYAPDVTNLLVGGDGRWSPSTVTASGPASESWVFELDISNGTQAAPYLAMSTISYRLEDTDASSVLLTATNQSEAYTPVISSATSLSYSLSRSRCYLRSMMAQNAATPANTQQSLTTRGYGPGQRTQMFVQGVRRNTTFTAWLVENVTMSDGSVQERMWDPVWFQTKSSASLGNISARVAVKTDCAVQRLFLPSGVQHAGVSIGCVRCASAPLSRNGPTPQLFQRHDLTLPRQLYPDPNDLPLRPTARGTLLGRLNLLRLRRCLSRLCLRGHDAALCRRNVRYAAQHDSAAGRHLGRCARILDAAGHLPNEVAARRTFCVPDSALRAGKPVQHLPVPLQRLIPCVGGESRSRDAVSIRRGPALSRRVLPRPGEVSFLSRVRVPQIRRVVPSRRHWHGGVGSNARRFFDHQDGERRVWERAPETSGRPVGYRLVSFFRNAMVPRHPTDLAPRCSCNSLGSDLTMAVQFVDPFQQWPYEKPPPEVQPGPPLGRPPGSDQ